MYAIAVGVRQAPANQDPTHPQTSPRAVRMRPGVGQPRFPALEAAA